MFENMDSSKIVKLSCDHIAFLVDLSLQYGSKDDIARLLQLMHAFCDCIARYQATHDFEDEE